MLYSVAAASVPKQSSTNLVVYDKACTSVPAVVPTASNPTGAATSANNNQGHKLAVRNTCGNAPSGSGSQSPISQPTGITTAQACQAQCDANASCQSFVFGMVNGADQCMLYSVAAASVPKQSSTNLVVYDKACTSVPAVVPTASNPTGAATSANNNQGHKLAVRNTCGGNPTASTAQAVLEQPTGVTTAQQCQAKCDANASCQSFVFGMVNNADQCMLYSVAASAVPTQASTNLVVYDKACTSVPTQTPTASNPTGANTGSTTSNGSAGSGAGSTTNAGANNAQGGKAAGH
jgi:hypothetical protein